MIGTSFGLPGPSAGTTEWTGLSDTPGSITALELVRGNAGGTALEFVGLSSLDHGNFGGLGDDDHTIYARLGGRSGGQALFGGTSAADDLDLAANTVGTGGRINMNSPLVFGPYSGTSALYGFTYNATESFVAFVGGGLEFGGVIAANSGTFIYESYKGAPHVTMGAIPGFSGYTDLQGLPRMIGGALGTHRPLSPLMINAGPVCENPTPGVTMTTPLSTGMNWVSQVRASAAGTMTLTRRFCRSF